MKILILPRYSPEGPSSRIRIYNYIPFLQNAGYLIYAEPLLKENYINYLYNDHNLKKSDILISYLKRIYLLLNKNKYDLIWLQQEAFPWVPGWFEKICLKAKVPIVTDYDDAFFHRYDLHNMHFIRKFLGNKIDTIMNFSDVVTAGNEYLAERSRKNKTRSVEMIPSVIDITKYSIKDYEKKTKFIIGWLGSPATVKYLSYIKEQLKEFCKDGNSELNLVGANKVDFEGFTINLIKWTQETEVNEIHKFDIGIMPLPDTPWERGKCGFKLIQYMACGIPVIASPVGVNSEIVEHGINGYLAKKPEDWIHYFNILKNNSELRQKMGLAGRELVEKKFTYQATAPKLIEVFERLLKDRRM